LPNAALLLSDQGGVDIGGATAAVKDAQTAVQQTYPTVYSQVTAYYNKLLPTIEKVMAEWPKVEPAIDVVMKAMKRQGHTPHSFMAELHTRMQDAPQK
jgi:hypothetical protein